MAHLRSHGSRAMVNGCCCWGNSCDAASQGIHVTAYSPLGSPDSATMMKRSEDAPSLLHEAIVLDVAKQHSKPAAQVCRHSAP